jgi:catechol 2,3-dioxygenase-like lactoylglutathione lyase family enzyme
MTFSGFWHVSFTHSDLDAAVKWYTEVLGLEYVRGQIQENEYTSKLVGFPNVRLKVAQLRIPGVPVTVSGHHIELVEYERPRGDAIPLDTNRPGVGHWCFITNDIHTDFERLKSKGVVFKSESPNYIAAGVNTGGYTCYFLGPDGITLEMLQPPPRPAA